MEWSVILANEKKIQKALVGSFAEPFLGVSWHWSHLQSCLTCCHRLSTVRGYAAYKLEADNHPLIRLRPGTHIGRSMYDRLYRGFPEGTIYGSLSVTKRDA